MPDPYALGTSLVIALAAGGSRGLIGWLKNRKAEELDPRAFALTVVLAALVWALSSVLGLEYGVAEQLLVTVGAVAYLNDGGKALKRHLAKGGGQAPPDG